MIGVLGALSISGLESKAPGTKIVRILELLSLDTYNLQTQASILGLLAGLLLITKTLLSVHFTKKILNFLSLKGAEVSKTIVQKLLADNIENQKIGTVSQTIYAISNGVEVVLLKIIATIINMISDFSLLIIMGLGLLVVDAPTAIISMALFVATGMLLYKYMQVSAQDLGVRSSTLEIQNNDLLLEIMNTYREIHVRNSRNFYMVNFGNSRVELARVNARINFQPLFSKYVIEAVIVLGALGIAGLQFVLKDATHAIASLTIFLAAGTRIGPAFLRLQQSAVQIRGSLGSAWPTLELIKKLEKVELTQFTPLEINDSHDDFEGLIDIHGLSFKYLGTSKEVLKNLNLTICPGQFVAIVGPSGSGKSTLADLILGVQRPTSGLVQISNFSPNEAINRWPGAIGYVPQHVPIVKGTILRNVSLGFQDSPIVRELAERALISAQLHQFLDEQEQGIDSLITEGGSNLSGGQRQRIGIARALFTSPKLLVLDEATSALDGETEAQISESINSLKGSVTVVLIAHRLSTVREADFVVYMDSGKILAQGTFDEVRKAIPNFERQAQLMGL